MYECLGRGFEAKQPGYKSIKQSIKNDMELKKENIQLIATNFYN